MAKSKAPVQAEDLRVQTDSYEVIVESGKKRWPIFAGAAVILLIIIIAAGFIIQVPVITEETYYETTEETIVLEPTYEPVTIQKPITKTETYIEIEEYMPTRSFTTEECSETPLTFTHESIGDLSKQEWDEQTGTGWLDRPSTYTKKVKVCSTNKRVSSKDLQEKGPLFSRDIRVTYKACNIGGAEKECSNYKIDLQPGICDERTHSWLSNFHEGKDIIFENFQTQSTQEICGLVTKEIPLDEFHKKLGSFNPEKDYTKTREIEKTRKITEYLEETIEKEIPGKKEIIQKRVPKTKQITTQTTLWTFLLNSN